MTPQIFVAETFGTAILLIFGCGVVANAILAKSKGNGGGWLMISWGWALGVFCGVFVAAKSGAHLNPAVTLGLLLKGDDFADGVPASVGTAFAYFAAQMLGAIIGAVVVWLAYRMHFDAEEDPANVLGVFSTGPQLRSPLWNLITEIIATFVLVFVIMSLAGTPNELGPLPVALLVLGIGIAIGGPTGYAINPARDLGPRIAHALLPIKHKGSSDWGYAWIPVVGPLIGGALAGVAAAALF
ncbi:MIP/aquaporin family protein [Naumannella cuiyingiana]|uniref:Glycerol uptake facilitator protein n=1 Tax=Naumannella cuiyingiana TaxID=1347891 RepID=A0A7Z0D903_9ACTN|nr:MIP/aquaporin family protein [Naumannella cuiyingiana]NYI71174.1 glycerol uptake facilitator protein [Naumannella cuiyingiana]